MTVPAFLHFYITFVSLQYVKIYNSLFLKKLCYMFIVMENLRNRLVITYNNKSYIHLFPHWTLNINLVAGNTALEAALTENHRLYIYRKAQKQLIQQHRKYDILKLLIN